MGKVIFLGQMVGLCRNFLNDRDSQGIKSLLMDQDMRENIKMEKCMGKENQLTLKVYL